VNDTGRRKRYPQDDTKPFILILKMKGVGTKTYRFFSRELSPERVFERLKEKVEKEIEEV